MIIAYLAHPISASSSDKEDDNIQTVKLLMKAILQGQFPGREPIIPFAPYLHFLEHLNNADPVEKAQGMYMNRHFFETKIIDELWVCGEESPGVKAEIELAQTYNIRIVRAEKWAEKVLLYCE